MRRIHIGSVIALSNALVFPNFAISAEAAPKTVTTPTHHALLKMDVKHGGQPRMDGMSAVTERVAMNGETVAWTTYPTLKTRMEVKDGTDEREVTVVPQNMVAEKIVAYISDERNSNSHSELPFTMGGAKLDQVDTGGLYWFAAREENANAVHVASTVYLGGMGAGMGKTPSIVIMQRKNELEIIPEPFSRKYRSNEEWKFLARFNGKPLANQTIYLETQNGTKTELLSDALGVVTVHIPNDFNVESDPRRHSKTEGKDAEIQNHIGIRKGSEFVLATEHAEGNKTYLTSFNGNYGPDAFYQRNLAYGLGFTLLGMVGAAPMLRQRKPNKNVTFADSLTSLPTKSGTGKNQDA